MTSLTLLLAFALLGLGACHPRGKWGGSSEDEDGSDFGDVIPVPVAQFMVKKLRDSVEEQNAAQPESVKSFHQLFIKYLFQRHKFEEAQMIKEQMEGKEEMLHAMFVKFAAHMKAKKAQGMGGGEMGGMSGEMGGMSGEMGGMGGDGKEEMMKELFKKFVSFVKAKKAQMSGEMGGMSGEMGGMGGDEKEEMMKELFKKFVSFVKAKKAQMSGDMGGKGGDMGDDMGGMGGDMGGMGGEKEMDPMKKLKLEMLWKELMQFDTSFQAGQKLMEKDLTREDTARVFFEIFLRFLEASKKLEEKAKHAAFALKHVQAAKERGKQEREQQEKEEKIKKLFKTFMQWHMKQMKEMEGW